ncbi:MAG: hypothetical protein ABI481_08290 [Pyrinomonadaceae bacterium]
MTSVSLLASAMRLPASMAFSVGIKPTAPTVAETTISASGVSLPANQRRGGDSRLLCRIAWTNQVERPEPLRGGLVRRPADVLEQQKKRAARGDLATEAGFERLAEVQEEILSRPPCFSMTSYMTHPEVGGPSHG